MFLSRLLNKKSRNHQQSYPDTKQSVGDIESMPVVAAVIEVDEVSHQAVVESPVIQIAANPRGEKSQSNIDQFLPVSPEEEDPENRYHRDA